MSDERFGADYYARFYGRSPVHNQRSIGELASGVLGMAAWWKMPIRSVLDVGAGKGYWGKWLAGHRPEVRYHGIDVSEHACRRYGHEQADLATWRPSRQYDLVVCQSVLQYLDGGDAKAAIAALGAAARGLLMLEVPTDGDRQSNIDSSSTDLDVHWRTAGWYRKRLAGHFRQIGGGLWIAADHPAVWFELEVPER